MKISIYNNSKFQDAYFWSYPYDFSTYTDDVIITTTDPGFFGNQKLSYSNCGVVSNIFLKTSQIYNIDLDD